MKSGNRYLRSIRKLYWGHDEVVAVERLLQVYRYPGAPLDLIAANLGVVDVRFEQSPFDVGIFETKGQTIIKINAFSSIVRQRFTLAHELAHLIFMQRLDVDSECMADVQLENACDRLAVELLMPRYET